MRHGAMRNRNFRLLLAGGTISGLGSSLLLVAAPVQVFRLTGSTLATGLTLAIEALPAILVGPWAGALVDRWSRKHIMVAADVLSAAGVAVILLGTTAARVPYIYLGLLAENLAVVFYRPAARAILPSVVGADLAAANAASAFAGGAVRLIGPVLGTLLLTGGGLGVVVGLDIASYLIAAAMTATVTRPPPTRDPTGHLRDGWRFLARTPILRGLLIITWVYWTANAALTTLLVPFVVHRLDSPGQDVGYLVSGLGIGYLLGSAVSRPLIARCATKPVLALAYTGVGTSFLLLFNASTLLTATIATAFAGIPGAIALVATQHRLQTATPGALLGRVGAAFYASDAVAAVAGALLAPALTAAGGLGAALNLLSAAVLATAAATTVLLPRTTPPPARVPEPVRPLSVDCPLCDRP